MKWLKHPLILAFLVTLALHCFFIYRGDVLPRQITKLVLVPLLLAYFAIGTPRKRGVLLALFFSFVGDALLIGSGATFFLTGMMAFIIAHMYYSFYFQYISPVSPGTIRYLLIALVSFLVLDIAVFMYLRDSLGTFTLPVLFYMLFISLMASLAAHVLAVPGLVSRLAARYLLPGAILFVISDAILAINQFKLHNEQLSVWVMLTYGFAQLLLTVGAKKANEHMFN